MVGAAIMGHVLATEGGSQSAMRIVRDDTTVRILDGEQLLLRYRHTRVLYVPYADRFFTPAGVNVLRDAPPLPSWHALASGDRTTRLVAPHAPEIRLLGCHVATIHKTNL